MNAILGQLFRAAFATVGKLYENWLARQEIRKNERLKNELSSVRRANNALKAKVNISVAVDPNNLSDGFDRLPNGKTKRVKRVLRKRT